MSEARESLVARMPVFALHAPEMRRKKLAVIPLAPSRKPHVNSFNRWRYRPGEKQVDRWCEQFPDSNIGILPALSGNGAMVADCDSFDAADQFQDRFGASDLKVLTRRGIHLYYERVPFRLTGNLKKLGLDVDIKAGNQIVIAPPSIHETGHIYRLDGCDWGALNNLRRLDVEKLYQFIHGPKCQQEAGPEKLTVRGDRELRNDSRALWLNDMLCSYAASCTQPNEVLAIARLLNEGLVSHPRGKLNDEEVVDRSMRVWNDVGSGKIRIWSGGHGSSVRATRKEIRLPPDALKLLMTLRANHSARCARGETFAIASTAMAAAKVRIRRRPPCGDAWT